MHEPGRKECVPRNGGTAPSRRRTRAFTLVELLVVIAIIGMLMAILMPGLTNIRQTMGFTQCRATLRGLYTGLQLWVNDHEGYVPDVENMRYGYSFRDNNNWAGLGLLYDREYITEPMAFHCTAHPDHWLKYEYQWLPPADPESLRNIFSSYVYRDIHGSFEEDAIDPDNPIYRVHGLLSRARGSLMLVMDNPIATVFTYGFGLTGYLGRSHRDGYNVLHAAGHVTTLMDEQRQYLYGWGTGWQNQLLPIVDGLED